MAASFHPRTRRLLDRVGPSIRLWRRAQGLTAEQVADRAGISRPTLRMIETHPERVTFGNVLAVLAVLGVDDAVVAAIDPMESDRGRTIVVDRLERKERRRAPRK